MPAGAAPANDTRSGAVPLTLNVPESGTLSGAANDHQLNTASTCHHGRDSSVNTAEGPDAVYSLTARAVTRPLLSYRCRC